MLDKLGAKDPRIDKRMAGAVGSSGMHRVCGITHQRNQTFNPAGCLITIKHGWPEDIKQDVAKGGWF